MQTWEAIFKRIKYDGDRDAGIPEEILWDTKDNHPIVKALLQIYYLMSEKIDQASNDEDEVYVETLGPLAYVMFPIAFRISKRFADKKK